MPRISDDPMVRMRATGRIPPESAMIPLANFRPVPVRFRTPMMMPAVAQAAISPTACLAPSAKPATNCSGVSRVLLRRNVQRIVE